MDEKWEAAFIKVFNEIFEPSDIAVQKKTLKKRAVAARPILVNLAEAGEPGDEEKAKRERKTITYGALADKLDSDPAYMSKVLGAIDHVGQELGDELLSPLVESSGSDGPGRGYFVWSFIPPEHQILSTNDERSLLPWMKDAWRSHLRRTYEHEGWYTNQN